MTLPVPFMRCKLSGTRRIHLLLLGLVLMSSVPAFSQQVRIAGKDLRLEQVFAEISKQTGLEFFYPSVLLKQAHPVSLPDQPMQVEGILTLCLQGQGLGFSISNGTIIIYRTQNNVPAEKQPVEEDPFVEIRGRIVDSHGAPVEMASVVLGRTRTGTLTDPSGSFILKMKAPQLTDVLTISFVGLKELQVALAGKTNVGQLTLQPADHALDESVVMAYGATSERFRTGDITTIRAAEIEKTPSLNVVEALAARVPGLYVRQNGSNPGSSYKMNLRGVNVLPTFGAILSAGTDVVHTLSKPLVVVDGLPTAPDLVTDIDKNLLTNPLSGLIGAGGDRDPLYWLNPSDVESITVLKDAEATALYGSRASNGVIMITTKKGKPGKTSFQVTVNTGINAPARRLNLLSTPQYLAMRREGWNNSIAAGLPVNGSNKPDALNAYDMLVWDTTRTTDWQHELLSSAPVYNAGMSLSGGRKTTVYRLSANYNHFTSSYPHARATPAFRDSRATFSGSVSTRSANNRLKLTTSATFSTIASRQPSRSPDPYIFLAPDAPSIFDSAGDVNYKGWWQARAGEVVGDNNPFNMLAEHFQDQRTTLFVRTKVSYELIRSLVFAVNAGYADSKGTQTITKPSSANDPRYALIRQASFGHNKHTGLSIEPELRYKVRWGRHHLELLAGGGFQSDDQEGTIEDASGYTADDQMNSTAGAALVIKTGEAVERKSIAALGRLSYRYADEILVDLSGRRDGSSSFGPGRRFGNFGSVGLGWIFTKASWIRQLPAISFGKIRGSYGITGTQSAIPNAYLSTYRPANDFYWGTLPPYAYYTTYGNYQGINTYSVTRVTNPYLGWVQSVGLDLGIDLYLFKDQRLKVSLQWYQKTTGNQIISKPVSTVTGAETYYANAPVKVRNQGIEAIIDYASKPNRAGWQWYVQVNGAANRNQLLSYPGLENSPLQSFYDIGQPLVYQSLYPAFLQKETGVYSVVDPNDRNARAVPVKVSDYPAFTGGVQTGISWKNISLSASLAVAKQKGFTNMQGTAYPGLLPAGSLSNQPVAVINDPRWHSVADSTIGGAFHAAGVSYFQSLDIYWNDASYVAIKNATLTVGMPSAWLRKTGIQAFSIYARAENLAFIPLSGYRGINPEQPGLTTQLPLRMLLVSGLTINL
ncbi:SusC/RagA family TonB-linked outer membrane protein [Paraflavitalea pollutisoli]|uniref:SusC/RagA family TonB-linked outer membrane protein n=1 Tax=Paraflavitalea pollutisoli TaxID=3034143 RepID=UPI0023ED02A0|nr:SusC/RagA family TonB-linked outer membrane protein [Paraflavitalea sp. H1-2-19X]